MCIDREAGYSDRLHDRDDCIRWLAKMPGSRSGQQPRLGIRFGGKACSRRCPTDRRVVAERFFDESGGMQLVLHAPFGSRINRRGAWRCANVSAASSTLSFSLGDGRRDKSVAWSAAFISLEDVFQFLRSHQSKKRLSRRSSPPLSLQSAGGGPSRVPLALLAFSGAGGFRRKSAHARRRSARAVFPAQAGCQDSRAAPDIEIPQHPLVSEACVIASTRRSMPTACARFSVPGTGRDRASRQDTPMPSVFSHQILNAMPYAFLDDARSRAPGPRRLHASRFTGAGQRPRDLSPDAIRGASEDAWPEVRDAEELHDALLGLTIFPENQLHRCSGRPAPGSNRWLKRGARFAWSESARPIDSRGAGGAGCRNP